MRHVFVIVRLSSGKQGGPQFDTVYIRKTCNNHKHLKFQFTSSSISSVGKSMKRKEDKEPEGGKGGGSVGKNVFISVNGCK